MEWLNGSFDGHGRLYISAAARRLAGVGNQVQYTVVDEDGTSRIVVRKKNGDKN